MTGWMTARASFAVAGALLVVASCGGGTKKAATTTSTSSSEASTSSSEPATTSSTIDPTLKDLLLVAADLPGFKEATNPPADQELFKTCDPAEAPGFKAIVDAPQEKGTKFVRGKDDSVQATSIVYSLTAEQAQAGLTELLDAKVLACLEKDVQALLDKQKPAGSTITAKVTSAKATVAGVDQTILLSGTATIKPGGTAQTTTSTTKASSTTTGPAAAQALRFDAVFLRSAGTILEVDYSGPNALATPVERQKIVAVAARKLVAAASGGGSTSTTVGSGSSTSSIKGSGTSTTRHSSTTTRQGTSTTKRSTSSSSTP